MAVERTASPIDEMHVPARLDARVVAPGDAPRLHGYDVQSDLARHYGFAEVALLALTSAAPSREQGLAFNVALGFLCPITVGEAPSHAASLAQLCSAKVSGVSAVAAIGLAEQARFTLAGLSELRSWLIGGRVGDAPAVESEPSPAVTRFHDCLRATGFTVHDADSCLPLDAAIVAALHDLGLEQSWQIEAAWSMARLPVVLAEAMSREPAELRGYPIRTPEFEITGERP
ncbi:MAG TPA: hypothetical protein ENK57_14675 [Polyangiaceae bacterium]|nr:hypothetical protein [Polyangiaceae bacterium]